MRRDSSRGRTEATYQGGSVRSAKTSEGTKTEWRKNTRSLGSSKSSTGASIACGPELGTEVLLPDELVRVNVLPVSVVAGCSTGTLRLRSSAATDQSHADTGQTC